MSLSQLDGVQCELACVPRQPLAQGSLNVYPTQALSLSLPLNNLPLLRKVLGILFGFCFWLRDSKQRRHLLLLTSRSLYKE